MVIILIRSVTTKGMCVSCFINGWFYCISVKKEPLDAYCNTTVPTGEKKRMITNLMFTDWLVSVYFCSSDPSVSSLVSDATIFYEAKNIIWRYPKHKKISNSLN